MENQEQMTSTEECCNNILEFINAHLEIDKCSSLNKLSGFDFNFIKPGIFDVLDNVFKDYQDNLKVFHDVHFFLNNLMKKVEKKNIEYVNIHETERSGAFLQITKKRGEVLKGLLKNCAQDDKIVFSESFIIPYKDIRTVKASASKETIEFPQLVRVQNKVAELKERVSVEISRAFSEFLTMFENKCFPYFYNVTRYITDLDVLQSKSYISRKYSYHKPVIDSDRDKSYFDIDGLRHVLIEHIQQNETYVTNNVSMGNEHELGMLLFGTNAVGKTSFIRALGIAIILAQSGNFVPCSHMTYKPYTAIFSRIIGNDNLFRGLSTFAVEMSELRIILKMANESSLILGDELCSGTETESALSIFTTGIQHLDKSGATYLFATHFHEIVGYDEIKLLEKSKKMVLKHMAVHYDNELNCLVYDRKLKDGSGDRIYGLEVCKSLYLEKQFLEDAFKIRLKYFPNCGGELEQKSSTYNSRKVRGNCEICRETLGEEIHHLEPQKIASKNGIIKTENGEFHKNHLANLISVCEKCHNQIHKNNNILKKKKTTKGYKILEDM
jgi:DNA mismatch repair protein MutS